MVTTGQDMPGGDVGIDVASWDAGLRQNLTNAFLLTRAVVPGMRRAGRGRVATEPPQTSALGRCDHAWGVLVTVRPSAAARCISSSRYWSSAASATP